MRLFGVCRKNVRYLHFFGRYAREIYNKCYGRGFARYNTRYGALVTTVINHRKRGDEMSDYKPYERKTYYYETDQMSIIHHANYIRWFEEARIDFLERIGIPYDEMERRGLLIPVLGVSCKYKKAFRYGDTFRICMKIQDFKGVTVSVTYEVYHKESGQLHATGTSEHGFVDSNLMPVNIKKIYPDIYECFVSAISDEK